MKIKQTRKLVESKEHQIRQMEENNHSQEVFKADKLQELSELMHKSIEKISAIREKQVQETRDFKQREELHIQKSQDKHIEQNKRITEDREGFEKQKRDVEKCL